MNNIDLLIIKYLSKNLSSQEQATLLEWLEMNEENQTYFRSLKDSYDLGKAKSDMKDSKVQSQWTNFTNTISAKKEKPALIHWGYTLMRYAAIFIVGALVSYFVYSFSGHTEEDALLTRTKIETGIGERSKVTLPDGSTVWINACSSVTFDNSFGNEERAVLLEGEAYFNVQTDTLKPFLVHTGKFTHRVTGTSFNVYSFSDEDEMNVALLEGGVTIEYEVHKEKLSPGEMIIYDKLTGVFTRKNVDVNNISSWRYGEFAFDGLTFDELSRRLERMYDVKFVFDNNKVSQVQFGGTLRNSYSLETIMKIIKTGIPINYKIEENTIYIN